MSESTGVVVARVLAALALAAGSLFVMGPFLVPLGWAAILAYLTWPLYSRVRARARRPHLVAALFTLGVALGLGVPVAFLLVSLADEATRLLDGFAAWRQHGSPLPVWVEAAWVRLAELLGPLRLAEAAEAGDWMGEAVRQLSRRLVAIAGGVGRNVFAFGVMMVGLYGLYVSGERVLEVARSLARLLFPSAPERFLERIGSSVRAVVFGLLGTALVQGTLTGVGLAFAGVPSPVALGATAVAVSLLPGGSGAVPLGAALWLLGQGRILPAVLLAAWGVGVVASVDNLLRPMLISGRGRIHFLIVFFGVLGGLVAFGPIGLFAGPVLLSVSFALLAEWAERAGPRAGS